MAGQHPYLNRWILLLEEKVNNIIINGKVSSNANDKMTIPDHAITSTHEFSVNHARNVNKPNKEHKIMFVADSLQQDVQCE
jgi:hypothetical protein